LLPNAPWHAARAVASHPRIAERARAAGFGHVIEAAPTLDALLAAIASVESSPP
jgi:uroporphyrinogen-III synthase